MLYKLLLLSIPLQNRANLFLIVILLLIINIIIIIITRIWQLFGTQAVHKLDNPAYVDH